MFSLTMFDMWTIVWRSHGNHAIDIPTQYFEWSVYNISNVYCHLLFLHNAIIFTHNVSFTK